MVEPRKRGLEDSPVTNERKRGGGGGIDRRSVLRRTGSVVVGVSLLSTTASAHPPTELRFCGCSQVCVDSDENYQILYAQESEDGYVCWLDPTPGPSSLDSPGCHEAGEDEKIIGVRGGSGNFYPNPNTCAQRALAALSPLDECTGCDSGCTDEVQYHPVDRHTYTATVTGEDWTETVTVRTRKCKPPETWGESTRDDGNRRAKDKGEDDERGRGRGKKKGKRGESERRNDDDRGGRGKTDDEDRGRKNGDGEERGKGRKRGKGKNDSKGRGR